MLEIHNDDYQWLNVQKIKNLKQFNENIGFIDEKLKK